MDIFDLAIIGGGPAGYRAAELAAKGGLKTVLFEKKSLGGTCLNEGCIPTKALLNSAKIYAAAKEGERFGVKVQGITLDHAVAMAHKGRVVKALVGGVEMKMKKAGVTVVPAAVQIKGRNADGFELIAGEQAYTAKRLLITSGSVPVLPPITGLKEALASGFAITSTQMLELVEIPKKLVVIGGGVIGLEMASYYQQAGATVEVVEMLPRIGGPIDEKLALLLQKALEKEGVKFNLSCKVTRFDSDKVVFEKDGAEKSVAADKVLVSIGRKPFTEGLGLEAIGVAMERGAVITDDKGRTSVGGVFAAGDVNGKSMLAHTAYREAELCVNTMLGREDRMNYDAIPAVIYTHPEVAGVGLTADAAKTKGIAVDVVELPLRYSGRYIAENPSGNDICIMVAEKSTRRILGVHMCGNYASEMIYGAAMMIERNMRVEDVRKVVFPHPTVSEILREAAFEI
jgi:dihydrolipoamide dehydrogenase